METLEELKAIIAGKPDNTATEFTLRFGRCKYYKFSRHGCWYYYEGNNWVPLEKPQLATRALSDIKQIIELMEIVEDTAALGFLTPSFDSGVSHKQLCKKYDALK